MWVATADLPQSARHPFYERLHRMLDDAAFGAFVAVHAVLCCGDRPSLASGRYFRLPLLGYFEGLDSERAIAWRAADSLSIHGFLDLELHELQPDHSTLWLTLRPIDVETHQLVLTWVLQQLADAQLVHGQTLDIDATTLEADAAMQGHRAPEHGREHDAFLTRIAQAPGSRRRRAPNWPGSTGHARGRGPTTTGRTRRVRTRRSRGCKDGRTHLPTQPSTRWT